jgi:hypothetical protein
VCGARREERAGETEGKQEARRAHVVAFEQLNAVPRKPFMSDVPGTQEGKGGLEKE